jgi:hypothetical protein
LSTPTEGVEMEVSEFNLQDYQRYIHNPWNCKDDLCDNCGDAILAYQSYLVEQEIDRNRE